MNGNWTELLAVGHVYNAERRSAKPHCLLQDRIEHRREVAGRGIDDLQYLGGCGLLGLSLVAFSRS